MDVFFLGFRPLLFCSALRNIAWGLNIFLIARKVSLGEIFLKREIPPESYADFFVCVLLPGFFLWAMF